MFKKYFDAEEVFKSISYHRLSNVIFSANQTRISAEFEIYANKVNYIVEIFYNSALDMSFEDFKEALKYAESMQKVD